MNNLLPRILRVSVLVLLAFMAAALYPQNWAKARLEVSPRHREYVQLKRDNHTVQGLVVYPEIKSKTPVVILIHEIFGLVDWPKEMADEVAIWTGRTLTTSPGGGGQVRSRRECFGR